MVYLAVDKDNSEYVYNHKPERLSNYWGVQRDKEGRPIGIGILLLKGTIKKIIGKELTWDDEPICIEIINNVEDTITIPKWEYDKLTKLAGYVRDWCSKYVGCPHGGSYHPEECICLDCDK